MVMDMRAGWIKKWCPFTIHFNFPEEKRGDRPKMVVLIFYNFRRNILGFFTSPKNT